MNILWIDVDNPSGAAPGGQSVATGAYLTPIAQRHDVRVVTLGPVDEGQTGSTYVPLASLAIGRKAATLDFIRQARRFVRRDPFHDVVIEMFTSPVGPIGLPMLTSKPVIGWAEFSFWNEMGAKYHLPIGELARRTLRQYRTLVAPHQSVADRLMRDAPSAEVRVFERTLPHGFSVEAKSIPGVGSTLLFIGRPDRHQKGIDLLARTLELIRIPDIQIEIAGFSLDHPVWRRSIRNVELPHRVQVLGYLGPRERAEAYRRARVVLMTSRYESSPFVPLEAARFGVPTVAFNLPCFADRTDHMFLAPAFDVQKLAALVRTVWHDEVALTKARNACTRLVTRTGALNECERFERYLEALVKRRASVASIR